MSFSYQSANTKVRSHKLLSIVAVMVVAVSFFAAGMSVKPALAAHENNKLNATCEGYVRMVLRGDLDNAYNQSATSIKDNQSLETYKQALSEIKTNNPTFNKKASNVQIVDARTGSCIFNVDGIPAKTGQRTDAVFKMGALKDGRNWKVASISVE